MPQDSTVEQLKKSDQPSSALQSNPSLTALYNSHSNKGSDTTLSLSNSAVFTNGEALVQKGTVAHVNNPIKKKNVMIRMLATSTMSIMEMKKKMELSN
jgi:hypothetical protein